MSRGSGIDSARTILNSDEEGNARIAQCSQNSRSYFLFSLKSITNQPFNNMLENPITIPKKMYVIIVFFLTLFELQKLELRFYHYCSAIKQSLKSISCMRKKIKCQEYKYIL